MGLNSPTRDLHRRQRVGQRCEAVSQLADLPAASSRGYRKYMMACQQTGPGHKLFKTW